MNNQRKYYPILLLIIVFLLLVVSFPVAGAENYQIDPIHTSVTFKIKHLAVSYVYGRFNDVSGSLIHDQASPAESSIEIQVKTESIDTTNAKRDEDLRSSNFFDAQKFPTIDLKALP